MRIALFGLPTRLIANVLAGACCLLGTLLVLTTVTHAQMGMSPSAMQVVCGTDYTTRTFIVDEIASTLYEIDRDGNKARYSNVHIDALRIEGSIPDSRWVSIDRSTGRIEISVWRVVGYDRITGDARTRVDHYERGSCEVKELKRKF